MDFIKGVDESIIKFIKEEIFFFDVKIIIWFFEIIFFYEFNENRVEKVEIIGKNIKEILEEFYF